MYYAQLKTLECFLRVEERRQRFVWTCLRGSPLAGHEHKFQRFIGSLYELRWHEVVSFLKQAAPLLPILSRAWDESRYVHGVDFEGGARPQQAQSQMRQEAASGLRQFDPKEFTAILSSSLFHMYTRMVMLIEAVPNALAGAAESCPCHRELLAGLTEHRRCKLLQEQYGAGVSACPMAGKLLPELVAGELEVACQRVWAQQEGELFLTAWGVQLR